MNYQPPTHRRRPAWLGWLIALSAIVLSGCQGLFESDCVMVGIHGVVVTVVEAVGGSAIAGTPTVRLIDGDHEETATRAGSDLPHRLTGAVERTGTYSIIVEAEGYATARRDNVVVTRSGHCNYLRPVELTIPLTRD